MPGLGCKPRSARLRASSPARVGSNPRLHRHNLIKCVVVLVVMVVVVVVVVVVMVVMRTRRPHRTWPSFSSSWATPPHRCLVELE